MTELDLTWYEWALSYLVMCGLTFPFWGILALTAALVCRRKNALAARREEDLAFLDGRRSERKGLCREASAPPMWETLPGGRRKRIH